MVLKFIESAHALRYKEPMPNFKPKLNDLRRNRQVEAAHLKASAPEKEAKPFDKRCKKLVIKLTHDEEALLEQRVTETGVKNKSELIRRALGFEA